MKTLYKLIMAALLVGCTAADLAPLGEDTEQEDAVEVSTEQDGPIDEAEHVVDGDVELQSGLEQESQEREISKALESMTPATHLIVKLSKNGAMEIVGASESRGRGKASTSTGDFVYYATVDGETVAVGSFDNPFVRRSEFDPEDGKGGFIETDEAVVVMQLPGIGLNHRGFDLNVERLSEDAHIHQLSIANVNDMLVHGGASFFGRVASSDTYQSLQKGRLLTDVSRTRDAVQTPNL